MIDLLYRDVTPKVPKEVRLRARAVLKHFPWDFDIERIAECPRCKKILEKDE